MIFIDREIVEMYHNALCKKCIKKEGGCNFPNDKEDFNHWEQFVKIVNFKLEIWHKSYEDVLEILTTDDELLSKNNIEIKKFLIYLLE
ncbi:MAG: hypothetical protein RSB67_00880 [Clostridia bacterium]